MNASRIGSSTSYGGSESLSFWFARSSAVGGARDHALGDHGLDRVAIGGELVDERLRAVLERREAAGHVAVQASRSRRPSRSCCPSSAASRRACSRSPSAGCRGSAPGCSPRSRRRAGPRTRRRASRAPSRTAARSTACRSARRGARACSAASSVLICDVIARRHHHRVHAVCDRARRPRSRA